VKAAPERCIVCGDEPAPLFRRGELAVVRSGCGLEWQRPFPSEERLRELYGGDYFARWGARDPAAFGRVRRMKHASYRHVLREITRLRRDGRLLDVGCAMGFLLEVAEQSGFEGYGLELNPLALAEARKSFGERVQAGELGPGAFPGTSFDVITLIDVLEHVPDPVELLERARARLLPGGVLAAVLPNAASVVRRVLRSRWPHYAEEHLFFWTPASLSLALTRTGLEVRVIRKALRKTYTAEYLTAYAAVTGAWLPPGLRALGSRSLRIPTGEMLVLAVRS
jgi:2-polyprenyl-3-methyl-5-hydroxy-6-metoxy-1,4-benzoquinol methylase